MTAELAGESDLVITMEGRHRDVVSRLGPRLAARTFTITELVGLLAHVQVPETVPAEGMDALVAALQQPRTRTAVTAPDVADPYGGPDDGYLVTARELADHVDRLGPALVRACT